MTRRNDKDYLHTEAEAHRICADLIRDALVGQTGMSQSSKDQLRASLKIHDALS